MKAGPLCHVRRHTMTSWKCLQNWTLTLTQFSRVCLKWQIFRQKCAPLDTGKSHPLTQRWATVRVGTSGGRWAKRAASSSQTHGGRLLAPTWGPSAPRTSTRGMTCVIWDVSYSNLCSNQTKYVTKYKSILFRRTWWSKRARFIWQKQVLYLCYLLCVFYYIKYDINQSDQFVFFFLSEIAIILIFSRNSNIFYFFSRDNHGRTRCDSQNCHKQFWWQKDIYINVFVM